MSPFSVLLGNPRKLWISRGSLFARQWPLPFRDTIRQQTAPSCSSWVHLLILWSVRGLITKMMLPHRLC